MPRNQEHGSNEHFEEKAQGFLGLRGKATYEHAEFLVLLMDIVLFRGLQALWEQVIPFDFVVHGAEGDMQE